MLTGVSIILPAAAQTPVPPARLREVNRAVEQGVWKAFRTEFYPTYDAKKIAETLREQARKK